MSGISGIAQSVFGKLRREGLGATYDKAKHELKERSALVDYKKRNPDLVKYVDVLFINGCDQSVPHPVRYRVTHQARQLDAAGFSTKMVDAAELTLDMVAQARNFIIFRYPYDKKIEEFISLAKQLNKNVYFDIDDLVVSRKYTDTIPYIATLPTDERALYDEGVERYGQTLALCNSAITTTEALAEELSTLVDHVFINRNTASDEMVYYSEKALYERDELPLIPEDKVPTAEKNHWEYARKRQADRKEQDCVLGYFSGSITHNDDFAMILPALTDIFGRYPNVGLRVVGCLDLPDELKPYQARIDTSEFCSWEKLPEIIADVDINLAPLQDTLFNRAKSENKWLEAALVKVPTVASNVGAFAQVITQGKDGILVEDDSRAWVNAVEELINSKQTRRRIGQSAYEKAHDSHLAVFTGWPLIRYLKQQQAPNIMFVLPSMKISGGGLVAMKHAAVLQEGGFDVTLVDDSGEYKEAFFDFENHCFPSIVMRSKNNKDDSLLMRGQFDQGVATLWTTVNCLLEYPSVKRVSYFVQNFEAQFYEAPNWLRSLAHATYCLDSVRYITMSRWCQKWLKERFDHDAEYVPNGIDTTLFMPVDRSFEGKIRILIEGDSESHYKNIDEAFRVVDKLDPERYEIWYLSYQAQPKENYRVDRFFHQVPHDQVHTIYEQCHILLKTSILESFSYPPLEMMATGGFSVVVPNEGNAEYLEDGVNCLLYPQGDLDAAVECITGIVENKDLRRSLKAGGEATVAKRDWKNLEAEIRELYR